MTRTFNTTQKKLKMTKAPAEKQITKEKQTLI